MLDSFTARPGFIGDASDQYLMDALRQQILTAREANDFLFTPVGSGMLTAAIESINSARDGLEAVDAADFNAIRQLQSKAYNGREFIRWLDDSIRNGNEAKTLLEDNGEQNV